MKLKRNVPLSKEEKEKKRKHWPFAAMRVGDCYEVESKSEWAEASKYAHAVASRKKWSITTIWLDDLKIGRIRRMK